MTTNFDSSQGDPFGQTATDINDHETRIAALEAKPESGGGTPVGGITIFGDNIASDYTTDTGERYLRTGSIELDTTKFDTNVFTYTDTPIFSYSAGSNTYDVEHIARLSNGRWLSVVSYSNYIRYAFYKDDPRNTSGVKSVTLPNYSTHNSTNCYAILSKDNVVLLLCANVLWYSHDYGTSWTDTDLPSGDGFRGFWSDERGEFIILNSALVAFSTVDGTSFTNLGALPHTYTYHFAKGLHENGREIWISAASGDSSLYSCFASDPTLWNPIAGSNPNGSNPIRGMTSIGKWLACASGTGIVYSKDAGLTWTSATSPFNISSPVYKFYMDPTGWGYIRGTGTSAWLTKDFGVTWEAAGATSANNAHTEWYNTDLENGPYIYTQADGNNETAIIGLHGHFAGMLYPTKSTDLPDVNYYQRIK